MGFRAAQAKGPSVGPISGGGTGTVTSTFTAGFIPLATSTTNLGNSLVSQTGPPYVVTVAASLTVTDAVTFASLAGTGTRMVVADGDGLLSTQTIPSGGSLANPTGTVGLTAVNGVLTSAMRSDGAPALSQAIAPTWSATHTFTLKPILSSLTASLPVFSDGTKGLVSNTMTGTGNVVMSASPTLTGTIGAASATFSGSITVGTTSLHTGVATFTAQPIFSSVTASTAAAFDASKGLVSVTNTGTGNNVLSASPTFTGTIVAASMTLSTSLTIGTTLGVTGVTTLTDLAGSGTRMVVASATGVLSTQSIPAGASLADPTGTIGLAVVNGVLTSGMRSDGAPALSQAIAPTWSATHTFTLKPILSSLTASLPVFSDGSKGLVSNAMTGTGNVVMSASPTLTGTITAAAATLSGILTLNASGTGASSGLIMSSAAPTISWQVTGAGTNEKVWDVTFTNTTMDIRTRTDALGAGNSLFRATRSGTTITSLFMSVSAISTSSVMVLNSASEVVGGSSVNGSIGTLSAYVALNSITLFTHSASISTDVALTSSGGAIAVDAAVSDDFTHVLTENTTVSAPSNPATGHIIRFRFRQAAGAYTLAWNAVFNPMGSSIATMSATNGEFGYYAFKWNEVTSKWDYLGATVYLDP